MADLVQQQLERMIPELEDLQERGIFSEKEIKNIVSKRRDFEYLLARRIPRKEDYLRYVAYELSLDKLRKHRRKRKQIKNHGVADSAGKKRVHFIYEKAVRKFSGDIELWHTVIDYATKVKAFTVANKRLGEVLRLHPRQVSFWIKAAKFHFEQDKDARAARTLLQTGLRTNKNSSLLWAEYLRLEALFTFQVIKRREVLGVVGDQGKNDEVGADERGDLAERHESLLKGKLLQVVYQQACAALPESIELRYAMVDVLEPFFGSLIGEAAKQLAGQIWRDACELESSTPKEESFEGLMQYLSKHGGLAANAILKHYEEALRDIGTPKMIELYAKYLVQIAVETDQPLKRRKKATQTAPPQTKLIRILEDEDRGLTVKTLEYIGLLFKEDESIVSQCLERSEMKSPDLASLRLTFCKSVGERRTLMRDFFDHLDDAYDTVSVERAVLGNLQVSVSDSSLDVSQVIDEFLNAVDLWYHLGATKHENEIVKILNNLIEWAKQSSRPNTQLETVENIFLGRIQRHPLPPVIPQKVYKKFLDTILELGADTENTRKIFKQATDHHPESFHIWKDFLKFERCFGNLDTEKSALLAAVRAIPHEKERLLDELNCAT